MVGRGQAKIRKNVGRENGKTQSVADMENIQNVLRDSINVDEIGSTTNSPDHHEDIAIDNRLQPLGIITFRMLPYKVIGITLFFHYIDFFPLVSCDL